MKIFTAVISLVLFTMCNSGAEKKVSYIKIPEKTVVNLKETEITFKTKVKTIELSSEIQDSSIIFPFENTGKYPLLISKAISSCGCTVTSYPKDTIFPNEKDEVILRFTSKPNSTKELKIQQSHVEIFGNFSDSLLELKIIAKINPQ